MPTTISPPLATSGKSLLTSRSRILPPRLAPLVRSELRANVHGPDPVNPGPDSVPGSEAGEGRPSGPIPALSRNCDGSREQPLRGARGAPARSTPDPPDDISPRGKGDPSRQ